MKTILANLATFIFLCVMTIPVALVGAIKGALKEVKELWEMW